MIPARAILGLDLQDLARDTVRRLYGLAEEVGVTFEPAQAERAARVPKTLARALQRLSLKVANQIDRLPIEAEREAGKAFREMQRRMREKVRGLDERPSEGQIARIAGEWTSEIRRFTDALARRHAPLEAKYAALGQKMADLPVRALRLDIAPPAPWLGTDARGYYLGLEDRYGPDAKRITNILDRVRRDEMDLTKARLSIAKIIDLPEHRAALIMRQEIGRINQEVGYERSQEVGEQVRGLQAEWLSILDPRRSRPGHMEAHGQVVENDQPFLVRPDRKHALERLRFPKDPNGSPGNVMNCFPGETLVLTPAGPRPIASLPVGSSVVTPLGSSRKTLFAWRRDEAKLIELSFKCGCALRVTPSHKLFDRRRGWIAADIVKRGDKLVNPAALIPIDDDVFHVEHPYSGARQDDVTPWAERGESAEDFDPSAMLGEIQVDVVVHAFRSTSPPHAYVGALDADAALLFDDNSKLAKPVHHDDLSRACVFAATVRATAVEILRGTLSLGCLAARGGVLPLESDGVAGRTHETKQAHGLSDGTALRKAEAAHHLDGGHAREVGLKPWAYGFSEAFFPAAHREVELEEVRAFTRAVDATDRAGAGAALRDARLDLEFLRAARTCDRVHDARLYHGSVVAVRAVPGLHRVYNLTVDTDSSYFAGGIACGNCLCLRAPRVDRVLVSPRIAA